MQETLHSSSLFSLEPQEDLPPPPISPAYDASSLAFLQGIHQRKSESMKAIIEAQGWESIVDSGKEAQAAAFMIVQHADYDPQFQRQCHHLMLESVGRGDIQPGFLAFLTDRILCNEGLHQRFGTQIREAANGCFVPKPIENSDKVDELRASAGLSESLSDYFIRINNGDLLLYRPLLGEYGQALEQRKAEKVVPFPGSSAPLS